MLPHMYILDELVSSLSETQFPIHQNGRETPYAYLYGASCDITLDDPKGNPSGDLTLFRSSQGRSVSVITRCGSSLGRLKQEDCL